MKNMIMALMLLTPLVASADNRKPYVLHNGRAQTGRSSAHAAPAAHSRPASVSGSGTVNAPAYGGGNAYVAFNGRGFSGGRGRRAGGGSTAPAPAEEAPPHFSKPGALIRTAGQEPKYGSGDPFRSHAIEGGGFISLDEGRAQHLRAPGVRQGPRDTPPSSGGRAGGSAVTANGPPFDPSF